MISFVKDVNVNFDEDILDCNLCDSKYCNECSVKECSICLNDKGERCYNCYGSVIQLACECYACIQCIMYNNDHNIIYSKKYEDITKSINPIDYILENGDKFIPKLNKYMRFMVKNPGYHGMHFYVKKIINIKIIDIKIQMILSEKSYFLVDTIFHLSFTILFFYKAVNENNYFWLILSALSEYKLGLIAHEGCHNAIPKVYGYIYDLFLGSSEQWIQKHNKGHHLEVNKEGDPDVNLIPLLRIREEQPICFYYRWQHWYQYLLFLFVALPLRFNGVYYIFTKRGWIQQSVIYLPGICFFLVYPVIKYGFLSGAIFWLIQNMIIGLLYGIIFSVSHINDMSAFNEKERRFDIMQLNETADWSSGSPFWNYMTGGLNHQVIHHLYPQKSSYHYPEIVNDVVAKYGEKYHRYDNLSDIICSNWRVMKKMGK